MATYKYVGEMVKNWEGIRVYDVVGKGKGSVSPKPGPEEPEQGRGYRLPSTNAQMHKPICATAVQARQPPVAFTYLTYLR